MPPPAPASDQAASRLDLSWAAACLLIALAVAAVLSACSGARPNPGATPLSVTVDVAAQVTATREAPPTPTVTWTPTATATAIPPTPTPTPLHPLSIEYLRQGSCPASEIVIEETLQPGANYDRYIASYQSEGNKIFALLTIPWGETPPTGWPVVVFNHGFIPPDQYRTTERYVAYVDAFARHGYIVFRSDYRGHGFSEGIARGAYGSPDYTIDVLNAVEALKAHPLADPGRIGMWGHSMGGYITLRAMVTSQDIRAGVIWAGVVASYPDLLSRWRRGSAGDPPPTPPPWRVRWRDSLFGIFGDPTEHPEVWAPLSANTYLADLSGPVQLHHGTADTSVPLEFSTTLYDQIRAAGQTAEIFIYEGDNHNLSNAFSVAMQRAIEFFDAHVKSAAAES